MGVSIPSNYNVNLGGSLGVTVNPSTFHIAIDTIPAIEIKPVTLDIKPARSDIASEGYSLNPDASAGRFQSRNGLVWIRTADNAALWRSAADYRALSSQSLRDLRWKGP